MHLTDLKCRKAIEDVRNNPELMTAIKAVLDDRRKYSGQAKRDWVLLAPPPLIRLFALIQVALKAEFGRILHCLPSNSLDNSVKPMLTISIFDG